MSKLSEIFDIDTIPQTMTMDPVVIDRTVEPEDSDFDHARTNYRELITQGNAAIITAMKVASETENPRALEVLGNLIKTMSEVNKELVGLSKVKADIKNAKNGKVPQISQQGAQQIGIQNAVFVGSASGLNKMLKGE